MSVGPSPLSAEHKRLLRTALKRGEKSPERKPGETISGTYSTDAIAVARATWLRRMVHEHHSAAVFSRLLPQLMEAEAPLEFKTSVLRMSMDELRHAALCGDVVEALGGKAEIETNLTTEPLPEHADCPAVERTLRNVMFVGCFSETIGLALLTEERELTKEPLMLRVVDQLAADEMLHAKLGWSYLALVWPILGEEGHARMRKYMPTACGYQERMMLSAMPISRKVSAELKRELEALGVLDSEEARELYYATVETVVIPQLEAYGLSAAEAWKNRVQA